MSSKFWSFTWSHKKRRDFEVGCEVHPSLEDYLKLSQTKQHQESLGCFYAANGNGQYVGKIHLIERIDRGREVIIHEAIHASFEVQRHLGRSVPSRYEEAIVSCSAGLAAEMLTCLEDFSI